MQTETNTEVQPMEAVTEATQEQTLEQQTGHMKQMAEFQAGVFAQVVENNLSRFTEILMSSNGVTQLQKRQARTALFEAVKFALNFGIGVTNAEIRDKGVVYAGITNELASSLVKAMDNRTLLLALNMKEANETAEIETNTESVTQETVNE